MPNPEVVAERAALAERDPVAFWDFDFVRSYFKGGFVETVSAKFVSDKYPEPKGFRSSCKTTYYDGSGPFNPDCTPGYFHYFFDLAHSGKSLLFLFYKLKEKYIYAATDTLGNRPYCSAARFAARRVDYQG